MMTKRQATSLSSESTIHFVLESLWISESFANLVQITSNDATFKLFVRCRWVHKKINWCDVTTHGKFFYQWSLTMT